MLRMARSAFIEGYEIVLRHVGDSPTSGIVNKLESLVAERRPFAFEGAGKALRLRQHREGESDWVSEVMGFSAPHWHPFLRIGVGCAEARLGLPAPEDPDAQDGYGFQLGLLSGAADRLSTDAPRVAQGLGRAVWFTTGGDGPTCAVLLGGKSLPGARWRGVGIACVFAGDPMGHTDRLPALAGSHSDDLLRGGQAALELWRGLGCTVPERAWSALQNLGAGRPTA